eukprot:gene4694-5862_t
MDEQYYINARLINACKRGEEEDIEDIITDQEAKPDVNGKDSVGETALHYAARNGHDGIIRILIKHRANVNVLDKLEETPLHKAAWKNQVEAIRALVEVGKANVSLKNKDGSTPLQLAKDEAARKLLVPRPVITEDTVVDEEDSDRE